MKKWQKILSCLALVLDYLHSLSGSWLFIERDRAENYTVLEENYNNVSCLRTVSGLRTVFGLNLLANSVILKCKLWE